LVVELIICTLYVGLPPLIVTVKVTGLSVVVDVLSTESEADNGWVVDCIVSVTLFVSAVALVESLTIAYMVNVPSLLKAIVPVIFVEDVVVL
jgi:hypothetical protein